MKIYSMWYEQHSNATSRQKSIHIYKGKIRKKRRKSHAIYTKSGNKVFSVTAKIPNTPITEGALLLSKEVLTLLTHFDDKIGCH